MIGSFLVTGAYRDAGQLPGPGAYYFAPVERAGCGRSGEASSLFTRALRAGQELPQAHHKPVFPLEHGLTGNAQLAGLFGQGLTGQEVNEQNPFVPSQLRQEADELAQVGQILNDGIRLRLCCRRVPCEANNPGLAVAAPNQQLPAVPIAAHAQIGFGRPLGDIVNSVTQGTEQGTLNADPLGRQPLPGLVYAELRGPSQIQPGGGVAGSFFDGAATLRVTYRARNYVLCNDAQLAAWNEGEIRRFVERVPTYAIQGVPLPAYTVPSPGNRLYQNPLTFIEGQYVKTLVQEGQLLLAPTASWKYIWHDVPFYPANAILLCQGKVNQAPFDGVAGFPEFPAQTLLCEAPDIHLRRNACGQMAFRIEWTLHYKPNGWNRFPSADGFFNLATFGGGPPDNAQGTNLVFKLADFGQLFDVEDAFVFG